MNEWIRVTLDKGYILSFITTNGRGRCVIFNASPCRACCLAVASFLLHRRRHSERRWRLEGGFSQHQRVVAVEPWDLDRRCRVQDQVWGPEHPLEEWDRRRPRRTTCTALRCPGLVTRWAITPSLLPADSLACSLEQSLPPPLCHQWLMLSSVFPLCAENIYHKLRGWSKRGDCFKLSFNCSDNLWE